MTLKILSQLSTNERSIVHLSITIAMVEQDILFCNLSFVKIVLPWFTYLVTLKTLSNLTQRNTEIPRGGITSVFVSTISLIDPITTKQSKRLNSDTK